ncbi:hypothetical protein QBC45DRAFT_434794 [Copromyces sp. CBS 386.78]|nr:hypothetical protein QBC45DRAFT_434794 [Copromyces sp. CBS 386.78]
MSMSEKEDQPFKQVSTGYCLDTALARLLPGEVHQVITAPSGAHPQSLGWRSISPSDFPSLGTLCCRQAVTIANTPPSQTCLEPRGRDMKRTLFLPASTFHLLPQGDIRLSPGEKLDSFQSAPKHPAIRLRSSHLQFCYHPNPPSAPSVASAKPAPRMAKSSDFLDGLQLEIDWSSLARSQSRLADIAYLYSVQRSVQSGRAGLGLSACLPRPATYLQGQQHQDDDCFGTGRVYELLDW